jgi:hypothetical protein
MNEWLTELVSWAWGRHHNILSRLKRRAAGAARTVMSLTGRAPTATEAADFATLTSAALRMPALVLGGSVDLVQDAAATFLGADR